MKKAFTLVELLVVIAIIAILSAVLFGTFRKASETALGAVCLTNMKNLATATLAGGKMLPPALSWEKPYVYAATGSNFSHVYMENRGWISWYSKDLYYEANPGDWRARSPQRSSCHEVGMYSQNFEEVQYAFSHGAIYGRLSGNTSCYLCPLHKQECPTANWSYFMYFGGWADDEKTMVAQVKVPAVGADRKLLFGEIPFRKGSPGNWFPSGEEATEDTDGALQIETENIGANHKLGKEWMAHVAFMDGHVEKLRIGETMSADDLRELTRLLYEGVDITFDGKRYEEVQ